MSELEILQQEHKEMQPIFEKLFMLPSIKIREIVQKVLGERLNISSYDIEKVSRNDRPSKIEIYYWDKVVINWCGVDIEYEHGDKLKVCSLRKLDWYLNEKDN